jgi:tRNA threonylcarbamoyladenosine biosynthesis protein TsaE
MNKTIIKTADEMKSFAGDIASRAKAGDVYCLKGDLGSGKTTFAQGFISSLQERKEPVTSPTFNLVQIYKAKDFYIYHCDLYRLKDKNEFMNLGLDDAFGKEVVLIEWPEIAEDFIPRNAKHIEIKTLEDGSREVSC